VAKKVPIQRKNLRRLFKIGLLALPLVAMEVGLRCYDLLRGASVRARAGWYWGLTQDRFLGFRPRPNLDIVYVDGNHFDTNSEGFRDEETWPINSDARRIICVGESSTWGIGCATHEETWPNQLERRLQAAGERIEILNAGMPGYTTVENAQLIKLRLLKYAPQAIIYMGFRNDYFVYGRALTEEADFNLFPRGLACIPHTLVNDILMRSSLYSFAAGRLASRGLFDRQTDAVIEDGDDVTSRARELFKDQIAEIVSLCNRHDVRLLWVDQPVDYSKLEERRVDDIKAFRHLLHEQLDLHRVPLIQAHEHFDFVSFPPLDDVHLSGEGNAHLSEIVEKQLREFL
jgi:lysophospholipase L1-like esterase